MDKKLQVIQAELQTYYSRWKNNEHIIDNNLFFPEDYTYFHNALLQNKWYYEDLYDEYTKSFKEYIKVTSIFKLIFLPFYIGYYFIVYRKRKKIIKRFNIQLGIKFDI